MALLIVAVAVTLGVLMFRGFDTTRTTEKPPEPQALPSKGDVSLKKVRYTETSEGIRKWTLVADGVEYWRDREVSRLENIEITFYRHDSGNHVLLTARQGKFHLDDREVEVWGDVMLQTEEGMTFRSDRAFYSDQESQISSQEKVHLEYEGMDIDAVGMRYNLETRRLKLLSEVDAEIVVSDFAENKE
ncbi:MAG TPA: LPS export ABC transporter periplasmic protein LptC [Desulfuromonadales bacterium]|nr:LPS export ABC transporter periplasmic protein LptC [Desulfuromonadales bacterium]